MSAMLLYDGEIRAAGLQLIPKPSERGSWYSVEGRIVSSRPAKGSG